MDKQPREPNFIGNRLRTARTDAGISIRALAAQIGRDHTTVGNWELGHTSITAEDLIRVVEALGTTVGAVLGEDEQVSIGDPETQVFIGRSTWDQLTKDERRLLTQAANLANDMRQARARSRELGRVAEERTEYETDAD